ncbi:DNA-binding protein Reb1p [Diutina rugosa]
MISPGDPGTSAMDQPQEIGGARALMSLTRKEDDLDVEAAVMKLVGGTLDASAKRHVPTMDWDDYLDTSGTDATADTPFEPFPKRFRHQPVSDDDDNLATLEELERREALVDEALLAASHTLRGSDGSAPSASSSPETMDGAPPSPLSNAAISAAAAATSRHQRHAVEEFDPVDLHRRFHHITSSESLVVEAAAMACNWYNSTPEGKRQPASLNGPRIRIGPRKFTEPEIAAVDHFIAGYCYLKRMTREEVCERIWQNQRKKDKFWEQLTRVLPYRSRASTYKHIKRQYHVFEVRAQWTKEDDDTLRHLAQVHAGKWCRIGTLMHRMPEDCRDRWRNYVKCGDNRSSHKWSAEEERQLVQIVTDYLREATTASTTSPEGADGADGAEQSAMSPPTPITGAIVDAPIKINWTLVSDLMEGKRSRIQCRYKWNKLIKKQGSMRPEVMDVATKQWVVSQVLNQQPATLEDVDWTAITEAFAAWPERVGQWGWKEMKSAVTALVEPSDSGNTSSSPSVAGDDLMKALRRASVALRRLRGTPHSVEYTLFRDE